MKAIAVFILLILLFLLFKPVRQNASCMQACPYMSGKMTSQPDGKTGSKEDCQNCRGCNAMMPVPASVYIPIESIKLNPSFTVHEQTIFNIYQLDELPSYSTSNWKPPKC